MKTTPTHADWQQFKIDSIHKLRQDEAFCRYYQARILQKLAESQRKILEPSTSDQEVHDERIRYNVLKDVLELPMQDLQQAEQAVMRMQRDQAARDGANPLASGTD